MAEKYDWSYENSIMRTKEYLSLEQHDQKYSQWRTNATLSNFVDTVLYANEMNVSRLDDQLHYDYLFHSIAKKNRFFKNRKPAKTDQDDFTAVQQFYKYNDVKTKAVLAILTREQIDELKQKQQKGGSG